VPRDRSAKSHDASRERGQGDVDVIAMMVRLRGAFAPADGKTDESPDGENKEETA